MPLSVGYSKCFCPLTVQLDAGRCWLCVKTLEIDSRIRRFPKFRYELALPRLVIADAAAFRTAQLEELAVGKHDVMGDYIGICAMIGTRSPVHKQFRRVRGLVPDYPLVIIVGNHPVALPPVPRRYARWTATYSSSVRTSPTERCLTFIAVCGHGFVAWKLEGCNHCTPTYFGGE